MRFKANYFLGATFTVGMLLGGSFMDIFRRQTGDEYPATASHIKTPSTRHSLPEIRTTSVKHADGGGRYSSNTKVKTTTQGLSEDDNPNTAGFVASPKRCPSNIRLHKLLQKCENVTGVVTSRGGNGTIPRATIDHVHKAVWLVVPKAGSRSWLAYFANLVRLPGRVASNPEAYAKVGLNFTVLVPVDEINTRYEDYLKFVVTRHPLQRFVSGYYEVFVSRGKYAENCTTFRRVLGQSSAAAACRKRPTLTFPEFAEVVRRGLLPDNGHWRPLTEQIKPCRVSLDLVLKMETTYEDENRVNWRLHVGRHHVEHVHTNENMKVKKSRSSKSHLTRYDSMLLSLQNTQPATFQWLLDKYKFDMDAFGYTWNAHTGTSGCSYQDYSCC